MALKELNQTVEQVARMVNGTVVGDGTAPLRHLRTLAQAQPGDLTFVTSAKYEALLEKTDATAAVVGPSLHSDRLALIRVANPELALARIMEQVEPDPPAIERRVSEKASVAPSAQVGRDTAVAPFVTIEPGAQVGQRCTLYPGVYIGHDARVGDDCVLHPSVTIGAGSILGQRVVIHSSTVVGSDGFGYVKDGDRYSKIPQLGIVQIDDDVEIGSNVSIDRARFDKTHIQRGVKIDNLVQIGHNVVVGEDACILALSGIAGSTTLGARSTMAVQSGALGHLTVGEGSVIAARGGVIKDIPPGSVVAGFPHTSLSDYKRSKVAVRRLPALEKRIRQLERKIETLGRTAKKPADD